MRLRRSARFAWEVPRALVTLIRAEYGLRTSDLPTTCRRLGVRLELESHAPPAGERAVLPRRMRTPVVAATLVLARWPAGDTCLRRCLLVGHRLRRLGPTLRIGVHRDPAGAFSAHSWLEIEGRTLDPSAGRYVTLGAAGR